MKTVRRSLGRFTGVVVVSALAGAALAVPVETATPVALSEAAARSASWPDGGVRLAMADLQVPSVRTEVSVASQSDAPPTAGAPRDVQAAGGRAPGWFQRLTASSFVQYWSQSENVALVLAGLGAMVLLAGRRQAR